MLRVTIELLSAVTGRTSKLGTMYIANDGTGSIDRGNYTAAVQSKPNADANPPRDLYNLEGWSTDAIARHPKAARAGKVSDYARQAYNVWRLVARACLATFPEELPKGTRCKNAAPALDEQVMRGLDIMRAFAADMGAACSTRERAADMGAAMKWLDASKAEP